MQHLADGANVDVPDESGRTALSACHHGESVRALLLCADVHLTNADSSALQIATTRTPERGEAARQFKHGGRASDADASEEEERVRRGRC